MLKFPKILYFIKDGVPTEEERKDAFRYGGGVTFRNAQFVPATGCLEDCEGVAGCVPDRYAARFPRASEALGEYVKSLNIGQFDEKPESPKEPDKPKAKPKEPELPKGPVEWKPNS